MDNFRVLLEISVLLVDMANTEMMVKSVILAKQVFQDVMVHRYAKFGQI